MPQVKNVGEGGCLERKSHKYAMEIIFITINKILHTLIGGVLLSSCGQKKPISHDFVRSQEEPKVAKKKRLHHNLLKT